jgi:molybdopterin converting factor small subunit
VTGTRVVVRLPAVLAEHAEGRRTVEVPVPAGGTVGQVLDALTATRPRLAWRIRDETGALRRHVNVFVGDESIKFIDGLATALEDGATITIVPAVSGG